MELNKQLNMRCSKLERALLKKVAVRQKTSISELIRKAVDSELVSIGEGPIFIKSEKEEANAVAK